MAADATADAVSVAGDRIQKALDDLENQKALISNCTLLWKTLTDHFSSLQRSIADRSQALDSKLQALDAERQQALESLDQREASIPDLESATAALIQERRDSIVSEIAASSEEEVVKAPDDLQGFLRWFARRMDAAGLWRFMVSRRRDLAALRKEIGEAIAESIDPARLVVNAAEDFLNQIGSEEADRSWALGMLLRSLFDIAGKKEPAVSDSIKGKAMEVAVAWKEKFGGKGEGEGLAGGVMGGSEAQIFLQMVVAFGLKSRFDEEWLKKLVFDNASRKDMAKVAAGLGLGEKLEDLIDELVKAGKEIEAVYFAHECALTERFPPVPLLKSSFQAAKKNASSMLKSVKNSASSMEESSSFEINALRSIIKCVEACNLGSKFSIDGPKRRLTHLEKIKTERKRSIAAKKSQGKRTRVVSGTAPSSRNAKIARTPDVPYASYRRNPSAVAQIPAAHKYPPRGGFSVPASASYGSTHSQSPSAVPQQYYAHDDMGVRRSSVPYSGPSVIYGGYDYNPAAPNQQSYPH